MIGRYKINTEKSIAILYTNNEQVETKIKSTKPFITMPKKMKHLSMYLTNHVKEMYVEN